MRLVSWDIGINNLAYCIMNDKEIVKWDKIDILEDIRQETHICQGVLKNGNPCTKNASFYQKKENGREYFCGTHGKKMNKIPKHELCHGVNKNGNSCKLKASYYLDKEEKEREYYCNKHIENLDEELKQKLKKYITVDNISFYDRSRMLYQKLGQLDEILDVDVVLIENQPVHKNPIMKSIQMLLYGYYLMHNANEIHLLNATQKMKVYDGPPIECQIKDTHERNKYLAKEYCKYFLKDNLEKLAYFNSYDKKDDLADTYLQGLYFINNH